MVNGLTHGDSVAIHFTTETAGPYVLHGSFVNQDEEYVRIEGTVGDTLGHEMFVPKSQIKFIERYT
jgi:hypothetical protein